MNATTSLPYIAIKINEGFGSGFIGLYAPVTLPGLIKYLPSYCCIEDACVWPLTKISQSSCLKTEESASVSP